MNTGHNVNYYLVRVEHPKRPEHPPYTAECEDIILALGMTFEQGNAFKAVWRACAAQHLGVMKEGYDGPLYDAEKQVHYSKLNLLVQQRKHMTNYVSNAEPATMKTEAGPKPSPMQQPGVLDPSDAVSPPPYDPSRIRKILDVVVTFDDYQRLAMRTAPPGESLLDGLNHACLGFLTELAEVSAAGTDNLHACEELGDTAWYVALATAHLDQPLGALMGTTDIDDLEVPPSPAWTLVSAGRYATEVKRMKVYGKTMTPDMREVMLQSLKTMMFSLAERCEARGIRFSACLQQNIDKLRKRFPDKFSGAAAEARADKGGKDARES